MKTFFVIASLAFLAVCLARPQTGKDATIVKYENENTIDGYKFNFETSDGMKRDEEGTSKDVGGTEGPAIVVRGSFSWKDAETGQEYTVNYIADENGYQPEGAHIPKRK